MYNEWLWLGHTGLVLNCQPKNIKITGASVFLKLVERNAKATISSLQFLRWWAEALCVEMGFMQTLLRKQNATAELKSSSSYFGIFEYLLSTMVTYVIHRSFKPIQIFNPYLFTRNIHVKPISTHSGWGGGWTYQLECETRCFARLTLAGQRLFTTWAFFKKSKKNRIDGNNPVLLQTRRMWWRCMSCGFRSGTETHRVKNYSWACNLLVPDAAAAPPPSPLSLHLNNPVYYKTSAKAR